MMWYVNMVHINMQWMIDHPQLAVRSTRRPRRRRSSAAHIHHGTWLKLITHSDMAMDQYLLIPFLVGWTSIYQLFWCSPGVQGFDTLPYQYVISRVYSWMFVIIFIISVQETHHNIFMKTHDFRNLLRWAAEIWWNLPISKTTMESHESFSRRSKATPKRCREMAVRCDWHIAHHVSNIFFFYMGSTRLVSTSGRQIFWDFGNFGTIFRHVAPGEACISKRKNRKSPRNAEASWWQTHHPPWGIRIIQTPQYPRKGCFDGETDDKPWNLVSALF